jgi:hypothetical protein
MSTMFLPVFHKSKPTTGILELCVKNWKWDFMSIYRIITFGDRKMKEKIWEKNHAGDSAFTSLMDIFGRDRYKMNNHKGKVSEKW